MFIVSIHTLVITYTDQLTSTQIRLHVHGHLIEIHQSSTIIKIMMEK